LSALLVAAFVIALGGWGRWPWRAVSAGLLSSAAFAQHDPAASGGRKLHPLQPSLADGRSLAIYPPQTLDLPFSHRVHLGLDQGMTCATCHPDAAQSVRASDDLLPPMSQCVTCHPALPPRPPPFIPAASLHFSHRLHADAGVACARCHGDVPSVDLATRADLPTMSDCWTCHTDQPGEPSRACGTCHLTITSGALQTDLPYGPLVPSRVVSGGDHRLDILDRHSAYAIDNAKACAACHSDRFCLDCHNSTVKPIAFHPPSYNHLHAIDARAAGTPSCTQSCHNLQQFCESCHALTQAGPALRPLTAPAFHPAGFAQDPQSPDFHAALARRDVTACASCHQEQACLTCHTVINPHGPDFLSRCAAMASRNTSACARCHDPSGGAWLDACR
jgi:hypothetical protein